MTPILLTGGTGYLGSQIFLAGRARHLPLQRVGRSAAVDYPCDLTVAAEFKAILEATGAHTVIHCAAEVPKTPEAYRSSDAGDRSLQMLRSVLAARPARVIFCSSMTVYPAGLDRPALPQDARATGPGYAAAKLAAEAEMFAAAGVQAIILRLPGLFGLRSNGILYNAARAFVKGVPLALAADLPHWAAIHIEDAADMVLRALDIPESEQKCIINVGYPGIFSIPDAVRRLATLFDAEAAELPTAPLFEMDLSEQRRLLGEPARDFDSRLAELVAQVRMELAA